MLQRFCLLLCLALLLPPLATGCGDGTNANGDATPADTSAMPAVPPGTRTDAPPATDRPDTMQDTLQIEGMAEPVTLTLFNEAGIPFTTYLPEGTFAPRLSTEAEGVAVYFDWAAGGTTNPNAYLQFFSPAGEMAIYDVAGLDAYLKAPSGILENNGWKIREDANVPACPWADVAYRYDDERSDVPAVGYFCLGMHGGAPYYFNAHLPLEYADGFHSRTNVIFEHFRWRDTGAPLGAQ